MGEVLQFRKRSASEKAQGNTLCRRGFHKWVPVDDNPFDSKKGKLVTTWRCSRCGAVKNTAR